MGYFDNATATITGLRSMVADGDVLLSAADPSVVAEELEIGVAMSHAEAMSWMADVLDELLADAASEA